MLAAQEGSRIDTHKEALVCNYNKQASWLVRNNTRPTSGWRYGGSTNANGLVLINNKQMICKKQLHAQQALKQRQQATLLGWITRSSLAGANQAYQQSLANQMSGMGMESRYVWSTITKQYVQHFSRCCCNLC